MGLFSSKYRNIRAIFLSLYIAILVSGCATIAGRPGWVTAPPPDTGNAVYFVSAGSDVAGNTAEAEIQASRALAGEIAKYIGVTVSSDTTVTAKATFDTYQAQVTETIREQASALISGFRVVDRYIETTGRGGVSVYLLGEYGRAELEAEKARFVRLFSEREEAVSVPEREGQTLLSEGNLVRAAESFLAAAAAALTGDVDNALVRFERVVGATRESLNGVRLEKLSGFQSTIVGTPFAEPFVVLVTGDNGKPLENAPVLITYRISLGDGRLSVRTESAITDRQGYIRFEHPIPRSSGERELIISLDLRAALEPLGSARDKARDLVDSVEDVVNTKRVTFRYRIQSESAAVPTAIMIAEIGEDGAALESSRAAVEIASVLTTGGFDITVFANTGSDGRAVIGPRFERKIDGIARILGLQESDGSMLVRVEASLTVTELSSGRTIYATSATRTVRSRDRAGSEEAAFTAIGNVLGEILAAELP
jgi:hypothetical protein